MQLAHRAFQLRRFARSGARGLGARPVLLQKTFGLTGQRFGLPVHACGAQVLDRNLNVAAPARKFRVRIPLHQLAGFALQTLHLLMPAGMAGAPDRRFQLGQAPLQQLEFR